MEQTTLPRLELEKVFLHDAEEIIAARDRAIVIHHTKDIDAAGDEVEQAAREVIQRKLARAYYVGHGHIVDSRLMTSPQLDVIIADNGHTPVLLKTENGTEYMPYESVYAIGEIKSGYYKSKGYIEGFSKTLKRIREELVRAKVPPNYLGNGITLGEGFSSGVNMPYRNPLFAFMLFVDGCDFDIADMAAYYKTTTVEELPNIVCILNRGILVNGCMHLEGGRTTFRSINAIPALNSPDTDQDVNRWALMEVGTSETRAAHSLALLCLTLMAHLNQCVLIPPEMGVYLNCIFRNTQTTGKVLT